MHSKLLLIWTCVYCKSILFWNGISRLVWNSSIFGVFIVYFEGSLWQDYSIDRVSAYFSDASQNVRMYKISLVSFWIECLMYWERTKVIVRQADPYNKTGDTTKGGRGCKIWLHQTFRFFFSCTRVLYHQYSITNHSESSFKSKTMSILLTILLLFFLSDLLRNILMCNCSSFSTLMTMYLPGAILCSNVL